MVVSYQVYGQPDGWLWRLVEEQELIARSVATYDSSAAAREGAAAVRSRVSVSDADHRMRKNADDTWQWDILREDGSVLATSAKLLDTRNKALGDYERFKRIGDIGTPIALLSATAEDVPERSFTVGASSGIVSGLKGLFNRGVRHRNALDNIETKIAISGIRGKTSTTQRLDEILNERGHNVLTKITGNHPTLIYNGQVIPLDRQGPRTTLYENLRVMREFSAEMDSFSGAGFAIFENQGITEYTTRVFNQFFTEADIVFITNVRQDHTGTLGKGRRQLARSFARSIPSGAHVVNGEQHPVIQKYLEEEIQRRGATIEHVTVPPRHQGLLAAETVHGVNPILDAAGEPTVPDIVADTLLERIQPTWEHLPNGRTFNGAQVNDVESTELVRRILTNNEELVEPFVFLRGDRRGRTASFVGYIDTLFENERIDHVSVSGANRELFADRTDAPATTYDPSIGADAVLDALFEREMPVLLMGNTVDPFMRDMQGVISKRAAEHEGGRYDDAVATLEERPDDPLA